MTQMLQDIDAIIFDMDGTLIDSMWLWVAIDEAYMEKYGLTEPDNFHEDMEGRSFLEVAEYYRSVFPSLQKTTKEIVKEWYEMAHYKYTHEVPLKKGAQAFIERMRAEGRKIGIATSNSRMLAEDTLKALGVWELFDCVRTSEEAGAGKPSPDVYLLAAKAMDVPPDRCLVFEDVPAGILGGKNAGMRVCAVEDDFSKEWLKKKRDLADYYIQDYDDVEKETYEVL